MQTNVDIFSKLILYILLNMLKIQNFGAQLRNEREKHGLTQSELAKKSGLTSQSISLFESERQTPTFFALYRLASGLDVEVTALCS